MQILTCRYRYRYSHRKYMYIVMDRDMCIDIDTDTDTDIDIGIKTSTHTFSCSEHADAFNYYKARSTDLADSYMLQLLVASKLVHVDKQAPLP